MRAENLSLSSNYFRNYIGLRKTAAFSLTILNKLEVEDFCIQALILLVATDVAARGLDIKELPAASQISKQS